MVLLGVHTTLVRNLLWCINRINARNARRSVYRIARRYPKNGSAALWGGAFLIAECQRRKSRPTAGCFLWGCSLSAKPYSTKSATICASTADTIASRSSAGTSINALTHRLANSTDPGRINSINNSRWSFGNSVSDPLGTVDSGGVCSGFGFNGLSC